MMEYLRMCDLEQRFGLSKTTLYRRIKEGKFPKPIRFADKRPVWPATDIAALEQALLQGRQLELPLEVVED